VQVEAKLIERMEELGLGKPNFGKPPADYNVQMSGARVLPGAVVGDVAYITAIPSINEKWYFQGTLGADISVEDGYRASELAALSALIELKDLIGDLDRIERVAMMLGFITSKEGFIDQPRVLNGASDLFERVLGERGRHARAALGVVGMVGGHSVEIFVIFAINGPQEERGEG
jgi:enamine deaminase RidA (YjgF/YER057c/UK114 family)